MTRSLIGESVLRKEGREKVTGRALYLDDLHFPEMLFGVTVRSPVSRGRLRSISFDPAIPWDQFTIVTAQDIPAKNVVSLIVDDQPCLAAADINHAEEPILLLAHPDKYALEDARRAVHLDIEPRPALFTLEDSLAQKEIIWGTDNTFKSYLVEKGDVDSAFASADFIIEGEYSSAAQEQLYIEPQGAIATANPRDGVTVWGSLQCPYYVHKALVPIFGLPPEKIRVIQTETGGGFGGKEEYPSLIAAHAALLAWKSGRPVKIVYDRAEDMAATTKRHPSRTRLRTAVSRDGKLLAMDIEFLLDGGAYATLSSVVLSRGTIHAAGPYLCPNVRIRSRALATNLPPHGAFRGFGAPQSVFALECHLNQVARVAGLSPEEFRRRNFIREGQTTAVSQVIREKVDMTHLLDRALELSQYHSKRARFAAQNPASPIKRGIGFATFYHGAGFTGSGESYLASVVRLEATPEGRVHVLASTVEMGQGTNTILAQIAAEALGIPYDLIDILQPDTANVPDSGPTVASRTAMIVGKLVEGAALEIRHKLLSSGLLSEPFTAQQFQTAVRRFTESSGPLRATCQYSPPPGIEWDDNKYRGDAYGAYAWAVYVAEVSVDTLTCEIRVEDFVALQEVGKVINPTLAAGQIEGGVAQAVGFALYEDVVWREGRMANSQLTNYILPTSMDVPPIRVFFEELPYPFGPAGAKGIGELPMDGTAPAIVNAIEDAVGVAIRRIPVTPEILLDALDAAASKSPEGALA